MKEIVIANLSLDFALRIVNLYKYLCDEKSEFVMSKQLLRCGTSIGANVREAEHAESTEDFIHKLKISLKESNETEYWLELFYKAEYITAAQYNSLNNDCKELSKLLISIIKSTKEKNNINL